MFEFDASDNDQLAAIALGFGANRIAASPNRKPKYCSGTGRGIARAAGICQLGASAGGS